MQSNHDQSDVRKYKPKKIVFAEYKAISKDGDTLEIRGIEAAGKENNPSDKKSGASKNAQ